MIPVQEFNNFSVEIEKLVKKPNQNSLPPHVTSPTHFSKVSSCVCSEPFLRHCSLKENRILQNKGKHKNVYTCIQCVYIYEYIFHDNFRKLMRCFSI